MDNATIVEDFDLTMMLYQILTIAIMILGVFIIAVTIKKVWRFLDKATEYFDNKNNSDE
ncbi:hypothetical protein [Flavobacterium limnophilum]|uniref:hypothetical protein n=1 Tax=Flavobacterium limnophilum TaxID=3003262 RepID=UPI0022AC8219|nr:hypothetical protein [Flavobacterium limnophilum]